MRYDDVVLLDILYCLFALPDGGALFFSDETIHFDCRDKGLYNFVIRFDEK